MDGVLDEVAQHLIEALAVDIGVHVLSGDRQRHATGRGSRLVRARDAIDEFA